MSLTGRPEFGSILLLEQSALARELPDPVLKLADQLYGQLDTATGDFEERLLDQELWSSVDLLQNIGLKNHQLLEDVVASISAGASSEDLKTRIRDGRVEIGDWLFARFKNIAVQARRIRGGSVALSPRRFGIGAEEYCAMTTWFVVGGLVLVAWIAADVLRSALVRLLWSIKVPFRRGDVVTIGGVGGKVERVGWQSVQLRSPTGDLIFIANRRVWDESVVQTVAESGSQGIEMHLPVYADCDPIRARVAAREAVVLSPYIALDRPVDVALEVGPQGEFQVRVQAGVFDASQRAHFESFVLESYHAILAGSAGYSGSCSITSP
jgi:hypothetical protein